MIARAIIWSALATASLEPRAFESVLRLVGFQTIHARKAGPGLLVIPSNARLSVHDVAETRDFLSNGGDAVIAGPEALAVLLDIHANEPSTTVKDVTDLAHPERYLRWNPAATVGRFPAPAGAVVLLQDQATHQPLAFFGQLGKGRYLALAAAFDTSSALGVSRYPYFAEYLRRAFDYHPQVTRPAIEAYFDPGFRANGDPASLVTGWRAAGIGTIYAATWYDFDYARLIELCHANGIATYAWFTLPMVTRKFWDDHSDWRDKRTGWRYPMNLQNTEARAAAFDFVASMIKRYEWDGVNFAEMNSDSPADSRQVTALHRDVLERFRSNDIEIIVTALDSLHSPKLRESIGMDTEAVVKLMRQFPFTLQVEDAFEFWPTPADRYRRFAGKYPKQTMFDVNVVADRDVSATHLPSALATGTEFLQLLRFGATNGRVAVYSESTVAPQDWEFAAAALAADARLLEEASGLRVRSPHTVSVRLKGEWVLAPKGDHLVTSGSPLKKLSCELLSVRGMEFEYEAPGRCAVLFEPPATRLLVDGAELHARTLPPGHHHVQVEVH
jgi:hypothetical protein